MNNAIPITQLDYRTVLTDAEISEIEHECEQYEIRPAAAIDALQIVQSHRGWIDDESLNAIADCLQMSSAELEGVATFYNHIYRQPVGKHVIHLCDSISCWLHDFQIIADHLSDKLGIQFGQTTADGNITLLPNVCLGCCDKAPAMMLDGELFENLNIASVDEILDKLRGGSNG